MSQINLQHGTTAFSSPGGGDEGVGGRCAARLVWEPVDVDAGGSRRTVEILLACRVHDIGGAARLFGHWWRSIRRQPTVLRHTAMPQYDRH